MKAKCSTLPLKPLRVVIRCVLGLILLIFLQASNTEQPVAAAYPDFVLASQGHTGQMSPRPETLLTLSNLLTNGGFENGSYSPSGSPTGWSRDAWQLSEATLTWDNGASRGGSKSVQIALNSSNDARWIQTANVQPHTDYRLSGWIKTQNVAHSTNSTDAGANLSLYGTWKRSTGVFGTKDWTYVSLEFNSESNTQVTVAARLGYWSGETTGAAWFDDLRLESFNSSAAWSWQRLTANAGTSRSPAIAAWGFYSPIGVVWADDTFGNYEIFFKKGTGGTSWDWQRLSNNPGGSFSPAIAWMGSDVHVVWQDWTFGRSQIFYKRSMDFGETWRWQPLSSNAGIVSQQPAIAIGGPAPWDRYIHVVWSDTSLGNYEIFYKRSVDNGDTWSWQRLSSNPGSSDYPDIAVSGNNVHVVWRDDTFGKPEIFYKRSTDGGQTWTWKRLSINAVRSGAPAIAVSGNTVHVVWSDSVFGNTEIFYRRSTDNGNTWSWQRLSKNRGASASPDITASGNTVRVVWFDGTFGNLEIFYKESADNGNAWSWHRLSSNPGASVGPAIAVNPGSVHVVWDDDTFGNREIFYKRRSP